MVGSWSRNCWVRDVRDYIWGINEWGILVIWSVRCVDFLYIDGDLDCGDLDTLHVFIEKEAHVSLFLIEPIKILLSKKQK